MGWKGIPEVNSVKLFLYKSILSFGTQIRERKKKQNLS